jgi:ubiquinone biosynthesis protein
MRVDEPTPRVRRAVARGVDSWREESGNGAARPRRPEPSTHLAVPASPAAPAADHFRDHAAVLQPMPRRSQRVGIDTGDGLVDVAPPAVDAVTFKASRLRTIGRLFTWLSLIVYVLSGYLWDRVRRRHDRKRQAVRVRRGLERVGGTFVKIGQQVAMRIDLVPWEYCVELSKMLDSMPPFSLEEALATIEHRTGRPWQETFRTFDPDPVGSASVACVYQAVLHDGTEVAVKVRRPGIGEVFASDFRVLDWLAYVVEFLAIVRPGFTRNLRREFRDTLIEELDFSKEARFQDIFRRRARKKKGKKFFTAPKVHFDLSGEDVIVQEFVSGMWLWEVLAAVEQGDTRGLALMRRLNIDPRVVAKRILWAAFWSDDNLFFHADPHPANILVRPNSQLTFVDFGSCGSFDVEQRIILERVVLAMQRNDAEGMARSSMKLMEPLPPIDVEAFLKEAETEYMRLIYTFRAKAEHTEWWERTSARLWLTVVKLSKRYNIPLNLHTLRMIRATLLYDTMALRLDRTLDRYEEYDKFIDYRARLAKDRWRDRWRSDGADTGFLRSEEVLEAGDDLLLRLHHLLSSPILNFRSRVDTWVFVVSTLGRAAVRILLLTLLALLLVMGWRVLRGDPTDLAGTFGAVTGHGLYHVALAAIALLSLRRILVRLRETAHDG